MEIKFNQNELEILIDLVNEELEETQNLYDERREEDIYKRLINLKDIKKELTEENKLSKEIKLGMAIGKLYYSYEFKSVYEFLIHKNDNFYYANTLRDLYEKFDYNTVNQMIIQLGKEKFTDEDNNNEQC